MKIHRIILLLLLIGRCTLSAQTTNTPANTNIPPSGRKLTEAKVLLLAEPVLQKQTDEFYTVHFTNNDWVVASMPITGRPGRDTYREMTIRDLDGKVLEITNRPIRREWRPGLAITNLHSQQSQNSSR
jgi:hypothetical protein